MDDNLSTQFFSFEVNMDKKVNDILETVFRALTEKGYNPVNQIVGYIMSGRPQPYYEG